MNESKQQQLNHASASNKMPDCLAREPAHDNVAKQIADIGNGIRRFIGETAIEHISVAELRPNPQNARTHPERQIAQLAASIEAFGFVGALVVDENNMLIAGHGRLEAGRRLGMEKIPCVRVTHLSGQAKLALTLADNRLAELSSWDDVALAQTLEVLSADGLDFDLEITGFDTPDLDRLLGPEPDPRTRSRTCEEFSSNRDDELPSLVTGRSPISRLGDLWTLGQHRLLHGDALDPESYHRLLGDEYATQIVTDPPYNVANRGHVSSKAFREFAMAHGEMSPREFSEFLARALTLCGNSAKDGAIFHVCMDWRHIGELTSAAAKAELQVKNICTWVKPSPGQGSFYRSQYEFIFVLKHGLEPHINNFGLGARGRVRSNVWRYPAVRGARRGINEPDGGHPTVKPVSMIMDAIRDCSRRKDIVLDPFGGSGTTLIAAERVGRCGYLIELDGYYINLTIRRWQAIGGSTAIRASDGIAFDNLAAARDRNGSHAET